MFVHSEVFQINIIIWVKAELPAEEEKQAESEKLVEIGIIILCSMLETVIKLKKNKEDVGD